MHQHFLAAPKPARHVPTRMRRPVKHTTVAAAIAFTLAITGAATLGAAYAAHAQTSGPSVVAETEESVPYYVVQSSVNGQQEFLFEIAQRFLGDGNRFNEIFELNEGRKQPDGTAMTTPTSLLPGWILQLPDDAKGPGVEFGPLPGSLPAEPQPESTPAEPPAESPTASPTPSAPQPTKTPAAPTPTPAAAPVADTDSGGVPVLVWILLAIVLLGAAAAGVITWLRKRKKAAATPEAITPIVDRSASWTIDSALKVLVSACDAEQIRFPGLYTVTVDDSSIHILLSTPTAKVPSGWTSSSDGRTWSASLAYLQGQRVPEVSIPQFSKLVTLGTAQTGRLLLDFSHANGPISIEGPASATTDVVEGWLSEFTSNPWSGTPQIVRLGARDTAGRETLDQFIGRLDAAGEGIAVLDAPPTRSQGEALRALYSTPDFGWTVIVAGAYAGASWTFTARDGVLTSGLVPDVRYSAAAGIR